MSVWSFIYTQLCGTIRLVYKDKQIKNTKAKYYVNLPIKNTSIATPTGRGSSEVDA